MEENHGEDQGYGRETTTAADEFVARVDQECGVLIGDGAMALYVEYLRSGGDIHKLGDAVVAASNEDTLRIVLTDIVEELLKGQSKNEK